MHEEDGNNAKQVKHTKEEESDKAKRPTKQYDNHESRWNPTRRRLTNKGYKGENAITPEKINIENQFQSLIENTEEYLQNKNNVVTVDDTHHDRDKIRKENKEMTTKYWVTKSFHYRQSKALSVINDQQNSAITAVMNLVKNQINESQTHKQPKKAITDVKKVEKNHSNESQMHKQEKKSMAKEPLIKKEN